MNDLNLDGLEIQREARGPWDEWDERDMKIAKVFNEMHRHKNRYGMNKIAEVLVEISRKELEAEFYSKYPVNIQSIKLSDNDESIISIRERYAKRFQNVIDTLLAINNNEEHHMVIFASKCIESDGYIGVTSYLCSIEKLMRANDVSEVQTYAYIDVPWNEAINYYVANTEYTRENIISVIADFIKEITYFGFDKESHDRELEKIENTIKQSEESCFGSEKCDENILVIEGETSTESSEEQTRYDAAIKAINDFNAYCRYEQLKEIKDEILRECKEV